jgi:hypothetical protein
LPEEGTSGELGSEGGHGGRERALANLAEFGHKRDLGVGDAAEHGDDEGAKGDVVGLESEVTEAAGLALIDGCVELALDVFLEKIGHHGGGGEGGLGAEEGPAEGPLAVLELADAEGDEGDCTGVALGDDLLAGHAFDGPLALALLALALFLETA